MGGLGKVLIGSIVILLLAQTLNGGLTLFSLKKLYSQSVLVMVKVTGTNAVVKIEGAVRFGKPIEAFYGMDKLAGDIRVALPELDDIVLALPDGRQTYHATPVERPIGDALLAARRSFEQGNNVSTADADGNHLTIFAIRGKDHDLVGTLVLSFPEEVVRQRFMVALSGILRPLCVTTTTAFLVIVGLFAFWGRGQRTVELGSSHLYVVPLLIIVIAQACFSVATIRTFRQEYLSVTRVSIERLTTLVKSDLEVILSKGIRITSLTRLEEHFRHLTESVPEIQYIEILNPQRAVLYDSGGVAPDAATQAAPSDPLFDIVLPLQPRAADGSQSLAGYMKIRLSADYIGKGVRERMFDAGTLVLLAALAVLEMSISLRALIGRTLVVDGEESATRHLLARPMAFTFLLAWALPLSFVPLRMQALYEPLAGLPKPVVTALPISVEMLCALVTAMLAGAWTDRRGWHVPVLSGLLLSIVGAVLMGSASSGLAFIGSRGVVGLGYGLAWMGIQGFIFHNTTQENRAQGVSHLVAGIFAGHICGTAVGAMLAEQIGFVPVFLVSAAAMLLPLAYVLVFLRPYMHRPNSVQVVDASGTARGGLRDLLCDRNFAAILLLSVVPFSIAQVGLLYYSVPIYLAKQGVNQSDIGRVLMLYGLSVIFVAPRIARWIDRSSHKKMFIVVGGLVGGGGLACLCVSHGMGAMVTAVLLLGLGSCLSCGAQSAFALSLRPVHAYGIGKAMGVQRAADKLGQMLGPLIVGSLFTAVGMDVGLAVTGGIYLAATALFMGLAGDGPFRFARRARASGSS
jgi:predicted MFS family arabinose efflux permease